MKNIPVDIVNSFHNGWAYLQLLKEQQNRPEDFLFLEVNKSFERMCGLKREEIIGKKITDLFSDSEKFLTDFITAGKQVAQDEYPQEINGYLNRFSTFCKIYISSQKKGIVSAEFQDISDNYKKEKEYQTIIQTSFDGFWICDIKGKLLEVNQAFCNIIGYTKEELLQMKISDFEINESPEDTARHIQKTIDTGNDRFETKHRRKDGAILDIEITATYLPEDGGKFFIFNTDITNKKQAETALRESEAKYKTLSESSQDYIFSINKELRLIYLNQKAADAFHTTPNQIIGKPIKEIFPPKIAQSQTASLKKVFDTGETLSFISKTKFPSGFVWLDTKLVPIKDEQGKVFSIMGVSRDVTANKISEEEIIKREAKFRDLYNSSPDQIFLIDAVKMKFVDANLKACNQLGYTKDELLQMGPHQINPFYSKAKLQTVFKTVFENKKEETIETVHRSINKKDIPVELLIKPFGAKDSKLIIAVARDITERIESIRLIKENEKKYKNLFNSVSIPLCYVKEGGVVESFNPRFTQVLGYTKEDIPTLNEWWILAYPDEQYRAWVIENWEQAVQDSIDLGIDIKSDVYNVRCKNGEIRQIIIAGITIGSDFLATFIDVTKLKTAELKLRQSEENLKIILDSMPFGSVIIGEDRKVRTVNKTAVEMMGYNTMEEIIGSTCYRTFCPECNETCPVWDLHEKLDKEDKILVTKDGNKIPILKSAISINLNNEKVLLETFIDISNIKKLELEKDSALESLKERIKEIRCLYQINETFRKERLELEEKLKQIVSLIPGGWQFPSKTSARISLDDIEVSTSDFTDSKFFIKENIEINKEVRGSVTVWHTDKSAANFQFLKEEYVLLKEIAFNIAQFINNQEHAKAIVNSEKMFRTLLNKSPLPMVIADMDSKVEMLNESFKSVIGYTTDDFTNVEEWRLLAYPDKGFREKMKRLWEDETEQALQENQSVKPYEAKIRCKDGHDRIFSIIDTKIGDKYLVVFSDLTDRIKAEEERDRFFKVSLDLLCVAGTDGYFKQMNPAWENVLGWSIEELKSKPFFDFIHPDDIEPTLNEVKKLSIGEPTIHFTNRYLCKDGSYKWLTWNTAPFDDVLYAVATDITELKNTQKEVAELNTRLNFALEGGAIGVWEWILETNETIWDNRMEMMFGLKPNSFDRTFEAFKKLLHPDDVSLTLDAISNALSGKKEYNIIYRVLWRNGEIRYINAKAIVLKDATGKNEKMIGVCLDVTDLKKSEEQLQKTTQELKRSNQELEQFAYIASHDLQEPLRMVSSYTQLLEKRYKNQIDERASKYIHYAVDGAVRMQNLINDLLDYSRIDISNEEYKLVNSNHIVENAIKNLGDKIKAAKAKITYDNLPEIYANQSQIERLFMNLLGNAIKFHKKNENPIIHISAQKKKGKWQFSVKDNGIGIKNENHEKVFIIFKRLHGAQEFQGTGIGLAVCKRIVNRHGGEIWFESKENEGTTFFFTLNMNSLKNN